MAVTNFRSYLGETCAQAVRRIRLHRAATALIKGDEPTDQIATRFGYPNQKSFARAFSETYGVSPGAFRKAGQLKLPLPAFKTGGYPMHPIEIRNEPKRRMIGLKHQGAYEEIGKSFEAFGAMCETRQLWPHMRGMIAVYLDNPDEVPADELRSYAGGAYAGEDIPEGMEELALEGGKTAVLTYRGPYSGIHAAYHSLFGNWLPQSGEEPADSPCFEVYLNDPRETAPADLLTEICLPLK